MPGLSIQSTIIPWNDNRTTGLELWIFSDSDWVDVTGTVHGPGNPRDRTFTQRVPGLTNNTTTHQLTVPAFSLTPTLNARSGASVRLTFWIMQVIGQNATPIKQVPGTEDGLQIPATIASTSGCSPVGTCATFADLIQWNSPSPPLPRDGYYTRADVDRLILALAGFANPMTTLDDLIIGGASGAPARLGKGLESQVVGISGGHLAYLNQSGLYRFSTYGVKGDTVEITDAAINIGVSTTTLNSAIGGIPLSVIGKTLSVQGAGVGGATLRAGLITGRPSPNSITFTVPASTTVSGRLAQYGTDDRAAIQAAVDAAIVTGGTVVDDVGVFPYISGQINVTGRCSILGVGWSGRVITNAPTVGSRIYLGFDPVATTAESAFRVTAQGVRIEGFEGYATQRPPGVGWTPLITPYLVTAYRDPAAPVTSVLGPAGGDSVQLVNLMVRNLSHGIAIHADRPYLDRIYGQPLVLGLLLDGVYDTGDIWVHFWPFWSGVTAVHDNVINNATAVQLGRVDSPALRYVFAFHYHIGLYFTASGVGVNPGGTTSGALIGFLQLDGCTYHILADNNVDVQIGLFRGYSNPADPLSRAIWITSGALLARLQIADAQFQASGLEAIRMDSAAGQLILNNVNILNYNQANAGANAIFVGAGNGVNVGNVICNPATGNNVAVYGGAATYQQVIPGNVGLGIIPVERLHLFSSASGAILRTFTEVSSATGFAEGRFLVGGSVDFRFGAAGPSVGAIGYVGNVSAHPLQLITGNAVRMQLTATSLFVPLIQIPVFANNAAALAGSLTAGYFYRTGADPDVLCIVH